MADPAQQAVSAIFGQGALPRIPQPECVVRNGRLECRSDGAVNQLAQAIFNDWSATVQDVPLVGWVWSTMLAWASDNRRKVQLQRLQRAYGEGRYSLRERAADFQRALTLDWLAAQGYGPLLELLASPEWLMVADSPEAELAREQARINPAMQQAFIHAGGIVPDTKSTRTYFGLGAGLHALQQYAESGLLPGDDIGDYQRVMGGPEVVRIPPDIDSQLELACSVHSTRKQTAACLNVLRPAVSAAILYASRGAPLDPALMRRAIETRYAPELRELRRSGHMGSALVKAGQAVRPAPPAQHARPLTAGERVALVAAVALPLGWVLYKRRWA